MAYIGNTVNNQGFTPAIDYFNGDGTTVTFTLSRPVVSVAQMIVAIDNVIQNPGTAFTVAGNAITFTSAPLSGTNNIWVEYTSLITTYNAISQDPSVIGDITATGGFLAVGDFGNTYTDGTVVDYVTGNARITTGPADGITLYNGGTAARSVLMTIDSSKNVCIGGTSTASQMLTVSNGAAGAIDVGTTGVGAARIYSDSSGSFFGSYDNIPMILRTNNTERMRINTNGNVALQGGTTTATGVGITFPATQSASTDANCLDDYEEGSFTPGLMFGSGSTGITYTSNRVGWYTKVGNIVSIQAIVEISNKGSSTGIAFLTGLPFTTPSTNMFTGGSIGYVLGFVSAAPITAYMDPSNTRAVLYSPVAGYIYDTNFSNACVFAVQITYRVA